MDVYFISILIIGAVIFIKVMVIVCIYACRAKRLRRAQSEARQDGRAYPHDPHTQRSAIINFEETPQPILTVPPGTDPATLNPMLAPPPYSTVSASKEDKPPTYEQIMEEGQPPPFGVYYGEPATSTLPTHTQGPNTPSLLPPPQAPPGGRPNTLTPPGAASGPAQPDSQT